MSLDRPARPANPRTRNVPAATRPEVQPVPRAEHQPAPTAQRRPAPSPTPR